MRVEDAEKLESLSAKWQSLEERIKASEQITGSVCVPAINELRYSGRRFFEAWRLSAVTPVDESKEQQIKSHFLMAEQYFNNADHDLTDSLVSFYADRRRQILDRYGRKNASEFYARFIVWVDLITKAQIAIRKSRSDRESRLDIYKDIQDNILPELEQHYAGIVREEILFAKRQILNGFGAAVGTLFTILGWIAGILCLYAEWDKISDKFSHFGYHATTIESLPQKASVTPPTAKPTPSHPAP